MQDDTLPCRLSMTTIDGEGPTCQGSVIFEDDFDDGIDPSLWTVEHRLPYEHVWLCSFAIRRCLCWCFIIFMILGEFSVDVCDVSKVKCQNRERKTGNFPNAFEKYGLEQNGWQNR